MGNILTATRNGVTTSYTYDNLGQLTRVDDPSDTTSGSAGTTWVYDYDRGGNILSKKRYAYTTGSLGSVLQTISYTYGDPNWKDKMTAYNGTAISYDAIGNPTNDGTWTYTWEKGRQLKQMSKSGTTATFLYNADGLRIRKTVGSTVTNYTLHGKNIVHMTQGSDNLHFFYDAQNRPAIVNYNGTKYAYQYSLQGDVIGLIDGSGDQVVRYVYDAWGKVLSTTGSLASTVGTIQPFRYRGYIYDTETKYYYLRSRYYNPAWMRFLNADNIIQGNLFSYCNNNGVSFIDSDGKFEIPALEIDDDYSIEFALEGIMIYSDPQLSELQNVLDGFSAGDVVYVHQNAQSYVGAKKVTMLFHNNGNNQWINGYVSSIYTTPVLSEALFGDKPEISLNGKNIDKTIVKHLQTSLVEALSGDPYSIQNDFMLLDIDGQYGRRTIRCVKRFQEITGLQVDGIVGPKTYFKLSLYLLQHCEKYRNIPFQKLDRRNYEFVE